jgi:protein CpxP
MKTKLIKFATVAALATGIALAQTPSPNPAAGRHNFVRQHMARIAQELNLTDAQKAQAKTIFQQARQTAQPVRDQLKTNRQALQAAVKSGDDAQIQHLSQMQGTLLGQMVAIRSEAGIKFNALLTPDQRAKADQLKQQFQQRLQNRRNPGSNS